MKITSSSTLISSGGHKCVGLVGTDGQEIRFPVVCWPTPPALAALSLPLDLPLPYVDSSTTISSLVVVTGAFTPERMKDSDADFNIGVAVGALQSLPTSGNSRVFVAMNGEQGASLQGKLFWMINLPT